MTTTTNPDPAVPPLLEPYGSAVHDRPRPSLLGAIVAAGGALVGIGASIIVANALKDEPRLAAGIVAALLLVLGYVTLTWAPRLFAPAAVTVISPAPAILAGALTISPSYHSPKLTLLLAAGLWAAVWLVPVMRRSLNLGLALAAGWLALVAIAADASTVGRLPTELQSNKVWSLSLVIGVVYLCLGLTFDRRGWRGFATPFFAVGDVAFVWGVAAAVTRIDGLGGPALVVVASLVLGFVGDAGGRRLTTWLGGAGVVVGSISLATQLVDSKNVIPNALAILFFGTGMLGAGLALSRSDTGDTGPASEPEAAPEANDGGTA